MSMSTTRRRIAALLAYCALSPFANAASELDALDPLMRAAPRDAKAIGAVLVAVTMAGDRVVAVGENGVVLFSDDQGRAWEQAKVPVSVTLTAVRFVSKQKGWAVGHSGVILATRDGGATWSKQRDGIKDAVDSADAGNPLLDVCFLDDAKGFAVGAFGLVYLTKDGGATWAKASNLLPNPDGNHLYAISLIGRELWVAGERGSLFVSRDLGESFSSVSSPYDGSFFGVSSAGRQAVVAYGLRGRAFISTNSGQKWEQLKLETQNSWTASTLLPDGRIVLVGQGGEVFVDPDGSGALRRHPGVYPSLSGVAATARGALIGVGPRGVVLLNIAARPSLRTLP